MPNSEIRLHCFFYSDLLPWERDGIRPIVESLAKHVNLQITEVEHNDPLPREKLNADVYWIIARNWREALRTLRLERVKGEVFASVFGLSATTGSLFTVLWRQLFPKLPKNLKLITHSQLNQRFLAEIDQIKKEQLFYLPLPFTRKLERVFNPDTRATKDSFVVGTFGSFEPEYNYNYLLNVAHYVVKRKPNVQFRIMGSGRLYYHIANMICEMGLESSVATVESVTGAEVNELDLLLYTPTRNDHFLPLHYAAAARVPVVVSECYGIEQYVHDAKTGFVVPTNDTKPMGELVLRLLDNPALRKTFAEGFRNYMENHYSELALESSYLDVLSSGRISSPRKVKSAAA